MWNGSIILLDMNPRDGPSSLGFNGNQTCEIKDGECIFQYPNIQNKFNRGCFQTYHYSDDFNKPVDEGTMMSV